MNNTWKVSKYLISDLKKALVIYYGVIVAFTVLILTLAMRLETHGTVEFNISGLSSASIIFLFIAGLNCFKTNFKFMQANNISRKRFYTANIITLIIVSAFMAVLDVLINVILSQLITYLDVFEQIYKSNFFMSNVLWSFALYLFTACAGWFITMLYYRCNSLMKVVISLSPVILSILLGYINDITKGALANNINGFFTMVFSLDSLNPYIAALNTLIGVAGLVGLCYLLIYKAPVKN